MKEDIACAEIMSFKRCLYSWVLVRKVALVQMLLQKDGRIMVGAYQQLKKRVIQTESELA